MRLMGLTPSEKGGEGVGEVTEFYGAEAGEGCVGVGPLDCGVVTAAGGGVASSGCASSPAPAPTPASPVEGEKVGD